MENVTVLPSIEATIRPEYNPACSFSAKDNAKEYPPVSFGKIDKKIGLELFLIKI